ncbi:MAG: histidine kinase [Lentisphaerae bacterium GWF2_52_8]|nr:MAG: histidine kinase [Lentisphaerae bacterium GWF2_52_8]
MKILIVDDSATARMFIRRCLEISGLREAEFTEAGNGEEAMSLLKEGDVSAVFTDLNMPGMDGETLLRKVRSSPMLTELPVIIVSSAGNQAREKKLLEMGAAAVLKKPPSPAQFMGVVKQIKGKGASGYEG